MNIVGLNGSPNSDGNTSFLVNKVLEECSIRGAQVVMLNIGEIMAEQKELFVQSVQVRATAAVIRAQGLKRPLEFLKMLTG